MPSASVRPSRRFDSSQIADLATFDEICSQHTATTSYPQACRIEKNIPVYDAAAFDISDPSTAESLKDELYAALHTGPGVYVLKHMYPDRALLAHTNTVFQSIIDAERTRAKGDHFAAGGKNDRIWNSFGKHARADPASFVRYYANPWLALVCDAWLGPGYRVTAQCNIVKPGGAPQVSHRDYHLGFQTEESCARYPRAVQVASQFLTLQGAVAQTDMPLESGPTRFLPYSQAFEPGYMAYRRPEYVEYFLKHWVSVPLEAGDGVFFNPALFHAAGENNTSDFNRSANLLQISSAFGKPMEMVDTAQIVASCWDGVLEKYADEGMSAEVQSIIAAMGEGYPFPTNLDRRPPAPGGMAPESEQQILVRCLKEKRGKDAVLEALRALVADSGM